MQSLSFYIKSSLIFLLGTLFFLRISLSAQTINKPRLDQGFPAGNQTNIPVIPPAITVNPSGKFHYVRNFKPRVPIDDPAQLTTSSAPSDVQINTEYLDGFRRSMQSVQHNFTPGRNLVIVSDTRFRTGATTYLPYSIAASGFRPNAFNEQQAFYYSLYPGEGYTAFSSSNNSSTDFNRSGSSLAPGKSQAGQNRVTRTIQTTNSNAEVRMWSIGNNDLPFTSGTYPEGKLFLEYTRFPNNDDQNITVSGTKKVFKDRDGNVVLEQNSDSIYVISNTPYTPAPALMSTYYVYDEQGQLRYMIPPLASDMLAANSWSVTTAILDQYCYQYRYDDRGRKIEQKLPGKDWERFVYDKWGRLTMTQHGNLKADGNKWSFVLYDVLDRASISGIYQAAASDTREIIQSRIDATGPSGSNSALLYYQRTEKDARKSPGSLDDCEILSFTYYDNYREADPGNTLWNTWTTNQLQFGELQYPPNGGETPQRSNRTLGLTTGSKVKITPSPAAREIGMPISWRKTAFFYDDKGRLIYSASQEADAANNNLLHASYASMQHSFGGQILVDKKVQINYRSRDGYESHTELNRNEYDPATGRIVKTWRKVDNASAWTLTSSCTYDNLGRAQRKILGNNGETQDYTYNIRGQLTGINAVYAETGNKQGQSITFGESLKYDYGFDKPRYDGKIAGMIWRGSGGDASVYYDAQMHAYGYDYDLSGRLKSADYYLKTSLPWSKTQLDYSVSNLYYDRNGNIKSMAQRGVQPGIGPVNMDVLAYSYNDGNQLVTLKDYGVADYGAGDFQDGNVSGPDYKYDPNGNLSQDLNKHIQAIRYNQFNKPIEITWDDGRKIEYSYDATGKKVIELVMAPGKPKKKTEYISNYVYQDDTLQYALTAEGRTAFNYQTTTPVKEEYFIKDHLGNVRSTIDIITYPIRQYLASYEVASANLEGMLFDKVSEIRDDKPGSVDPGDTKAGRLNAAEAGRAVGTSLLVKVMAGDKVDLNVNNYYEGFNGKDEPLNGEQMLESVIGTLTGGVGGLPGESHNTELVYKLFTPDNFNALEDMINTQGIDPGKPQAYLTYALFDEGMKLVSEFSGAYQVNGEGSWGSIGSNGARVIPANGYLAVYLSSRHRDLSCIPCGNIFFDKLRIEISKGNLLAEDHYYPHGLPIAALSSSRTALEGFRDKRHKYQGNEYIRDLGLNWMSFGARQYDPQIGRFLSIDPLADGGGQQTWSPYAAMGNAPESQVDPNGTYAYVKDFGSSRASATAALDALFGNGNYNIEDDGKIVITNEFAATQAYNAYMRSGAGGASATALSTMAMAGASILANHNNPNRMVTVAFANNNISDYYWEATLNDVGIFANHKPKTYRLNVLQAANQDIGLNSPINREQRQKVAWFKSTLAGWMAVGVAPLAGFAAAEAAPVILTSFLGNPVAWTETGGSLILGAHGYEGELPSAGGVQYTKSSLKLGQEMHKAYKVGAEGIKEFRLPSGRRIDFLDIQNGIIHELKPFNPRAMKAGQKQLNLYKQELQTMPQFNGINWKTVLDTY